MLTRDQALRRCVRLETERWKLRRAVRETCDAFFLHLLHESKPGTIPGDRYCLIMRGDTFVDLLDAIVGHVSSFIGPFFYNDHMPVSTSSACSKRIHRLEAFRHTVQTYESGAFFLWCYELMFLTTKYFYPNISDAAMVASAPFLEYLEHFVHGVDAAVDSFLKATER